MAPVEPTIRTPTEATSAQRAEKLIDPDVPPLGRVPIDRAAVAATQGG